MYDNTALKVKRDTDFIPATAFSGLILAEGAPNTLGDANGGAAVLGEISTLGITGVEMGTDGDAISTYIHIPKSWDLTHKLGLRVVWTTASVTAADTVDWIVTYDDVAEEAALGAISTALDTVIAVDTVGGAVAYTLKFTERGIINGDSIVGPYLGLKIEQNAKAAGLTEALQCLGLEVNYVPRLLDGRRVQNDPGF